jgi:hypothetical protein
MAAVALSALTFVLVAGWLSERTTSRSPATVGVERFMQVRTGMSPDAVTSVLGRPMSTSTEPAEGLPGEPPASCWHYASADLRRGYDVCFVGRVVVTLGSHLVVGSGS